MKKQRIRSKNYPKDVPTASAGITFPVAEWQSLDAIAANLGISRTRLLLDAATHYRDNVLSQDNLASAGGGQCGRTA